MYHNMQPSLPVCRSVLLFSLRPSVLYSLALHHRRPLRCSACPLAHSPVALVLTTMIFDALFVIWVQCLVCNLAEM